MNDYVAPWWLPGGHLQTIYASLAPAPRVAFTRERWETPDGDFIDLDWAGREDTGPLLALFHGLEGSSSSSYARSIASAAQARGWRCVVPHFRGCSGELNRLPRAYHSGDSEEIGWILQRLRPDFAAGVSLGGNALLKHLAEQGEKTPVRRAAAICAPLDLAVSGRALDRGVNQRLYAKLFLTTLKAKAFAKLTLRQISFDQRRLARARTLFEFDDMITAPLHGFRDASDYYARSSSGPLLGGIRVPTLVLNARNDPFLPQSVLDGIAATQRDIPPSVTLDFQRHGGHAGFPGDGWLARRVLDYLAAT